MDSPQDVWWHPPVTEIELEGMDFRFDDFHDRVIGGKLFLAPGLPALPSTRVFQNDSHKIEFVAQLTLLPVRDGASPVLVKAVDLKRLSVKPLDLFETLSEAQSSRSNPLRRRPFDKDTADTPLSLWMRPHDGYLALGILRINDTPCIDLTGLNDYVR